MAVIVKGEITITKGFDHWKEMGLLTERKNGWDGYAVPFCRYNEGRPDQTYCGHEVRQR